MADSDLIFKLIRLFGGLAPDLRKAVAEDADTVLALWRRAFRDTSDELLEAGADVLLACHTERNMTPAHLHNAIATIREAGRMDLDQVMATLQDVKREWYPDPNVDGSIGVLENCPAPALMREIVRGLGGVRTVADLDLTQSTTHFRVRDIFKSVVGRTETSERHPAIAKSVSDLVDGIGDGGAK